MVDSQLLRDDQSIYELLDAYPSPIWLSGPDKLCHYFNKAWLQLTGRTMKQDMGNGWAEGVHPDDLKFCLETYVSAFDARKPFKMEYRLKAADGHYRWLRDEGAARYTKDNRFLGYIGSAIDITDLKEALAAHQEMEDKYHFVISNVPGAVFQFLLKKDGSFDIPFTSAGAVDLGGFTDKEVMSNPLGVLSRIPPTDWLHVTKTIFESARDMKLCNLEFRFRTVADDMKWFYACGKPSRLANGDVLWSGLVRDITLLKQGEQMTAKVREMQQREDFIATLAHDLKTPLIGNSRVIDLLLDGTVGDLQPKQFEIISQLKESTLTQLHQVVKLLEVYRQESGQLPLLFEETNFADILSACLNEMKPFAVSKGIQLNLVNAKDNLFLWADRRALQTVLANLLDNAIKFSHNNSQIDIIESANTHKITIQIQDHGIGMQKEELGQLFQRFWQGITGARYPFRTGLGLYLSKNIISAHDGELTVDSQPGQGTTMTIVLPRLIKPN